MVLVLAGGPSINDYPRREIDDLARAFFTLAVNETGLIFPCDAIVSIDPWMIHHKGKEVRENGKPLITRGWKFRENKDLDLIQLPGDEPYDRRVIEHYPLSGMMACKIADRIALRFGGNSYALGMDASIGHFVGHPTPNTTRYIDEARPLTKYDKMGLVRTYNLSVSSLIDAWPKMATLPERKPVNNKGEMMVWLRENIKDQIFEGLK